MLQLSLVVVAFGMILLIAICSMSASVSALEDALRRHTKVLEAQGRRIDAALRQGQDLPERILEAHERSLRLR